MRRIIIADVKSNSRNGKMTGHSYPVSKNYIDLFSDICEVKVAGGPVIANRFKPEEILKLPYNSVEGLSGWKNKIHTLRNCRLLFKKTNSEDSVVIQHSGISTVLLGIALFARKRKNRIYLIQYDTNALSSRIKRFIYFFAKNKITGIVCPSESIAKTYNLPECVVTDFIYPYKEVMQTHDKKKYDFAVVGGIYEDKGVVEVAEKFADSTYKVLIAGNPATSQLRDSLSKIAFKAKNIDLRLGFIEDNDYYRYIREAKYCILNYRGCYSQRSSGVVLDILFNQTPIIGHRCRALDFVEKENVGLLYDEIELFDPDVIMNNEVYNRYMLGIKVFLDYQRIYKKTLFNFLQA